MLALVLCKLLTTVLETRHGSEVACMTGGKSQWCQHGCGGCPYLEALNIGQGSNLKFSFNFQCWVFGCQPHWSKQSGGV